MYLHHAKLMLNLLYFACVEAERDKPITMTAPKVVVNYHIKRLKDKNPDVRLNAIEELRKIGDADAMEPLQELFNSDDNVDVKKAAQEAGRAIWQMKNGAQSD